MSLMANAASGRRVLFVMATEIELGVKLKALFQPLITGVGPVEGALHLAVAMAAMKAAGGMPDLVVSLGSAGSRKLEQGAVFQVSAVAWRDMDASPLGFEKGRTPFLDLPARIDLPLRVEGVPEATLSTGGNVVSGAAYAAIAEDMVDMETYAHLRAAMHFGVPLAGLRGISDGAEDLQHYGSWADALPALDAHLAAAVERLLAQV